MFSRKDKTEKERPEVSVVIIGVFCLKGRREEENNLLQLRCVDGEEESLKMRPREI